MGVGASLQELAAAGQPDSRGESEEHSPETGDRHSDEAADGKSVLKTDQISGIQGDVTDKKSEELNGIPEDRDTKQVRQGDPVLVSGGEEMEEMQLNKEIPVENEHGEQKDVEKGDDLPIEMGVPAEEVQGTEVCFNVFKCMGLKFAMKNEKPVRAEPVQLLTASQEEGGEAGRAVSEPRQEVEGSAEANSEAEGSSPEILTPEKAEECFEQEETKVMGTEAIPTAVEPAVNITDSPVVERLLRRFFRQDYFSGLRTKQSSMKVKEAPQITDKEGREDTKRGATERGPDAQPSASQDAAEVSVAQSPEKNQGGEEDFEDLTAELASVRVASEAPAVGEIVTSEVKENGATAEHSMATSDLETDQQIPSARKQVGEAGVDSPTPEAPAEFQTEHKKTQKKSSDSTLDPVSAEGEGQKPSHQDSPIKNLLTRGSIKKQTKEDKNEKGEASTGDLNDEAKLQSSTKWKGSPDSSKPDGPPAFPEKMDEGIPAESDLLPVGQEEAGGDGERKEAITAWASFKKLMTPKKHPKEPLDNERGDQATDKAKSTTISTESTASEKQEEPNSSGEESKLDQTAEDLKKKADTTATWEALICVASSKKRVRKQSESDRQKPNKESQASEADDHAEDTESSTSQGPDQEQRERSLSCAKSPVEGEATNEAISTWESFKRFMSPRRRSSSKLREHRGESEPKPAATEVAKEESWAPLKKLIHGRKKVRPNTKLQQSQSEPAGKVAADTEFAGNKSEEEPETPSVVPISEYDDVGVMQTPVTTAEETLLGRDDAMVGSVLQEGQKEATQNVNLLAYPTTSSCQTQTLPSSQADISEHEPDVSTGESPSKEEPGTFTTAVAEPPPKAAEKILAITGPLGEGSTLATAGEVTVQEMPAELQEVARRQEIPLTAIEQALKQDAAQAGECQHLLPSEHQEVNESTAMTISQDGASLVEKVKTRNMEVVREQILEASQQEDVKETEALREQSIKIAEWGSEGEPQSITPVPDKAGAEQITECRKTEIIPAPEARKDEAAMEQVDDTKSDVAQQVAVGKVEAAAVDNSENAQEMQVEKALAESTEVASLQESRVEQTAEAPVQVEKNVAETENFEDRGVSLLPEEVSQVETSEQNVEVTPAVSMMEVLPAEDIVEITAEEMMETESHIGPTKITSTVEVTEVVCGEMTDVTPEEIKKALLSEEPSEISPAVGVTEAVCSAVTTELTAVQVAEAVLGKEPIEISQAVEVTGVMCRGIDEITPEGAAAVMHDEESTEITLAGIREIITAVQPVEISPLPLTEIAPGKEPIDINPTMGMTEVVCSEEITEITPGLVSKSLPNEEPIKITPVGVTEAVVGEVMTELHPMGITDIPLDKGPSEISPAVGITEAICSDVTTELTAAEVAEAVLGEEPIEISQAMEVTGVMCRGIDEITPEGAITVMHDEESTEITLAGIREIITGVQPVDISSLPLTEIAPGKEPIDINATMGVTEVVCSEEITEITPGLVSKSLPSGETIKITPVGVTEAVLGEVMTQLDPMGVADVPLGKQPSEIVPVRITEALCSEEKTEHSVALVQEIAPAAIEQVLKPDAAQTGECQPLPPEEHQVVDENVFTTTISKDGALLVEEEKTGNKEVVREQMLAAGQSEDDAETDADKEQSLKSAEEQGEGEPQITTPVPDKAGAEQIIEYRKAMEQVDDTKSDVAQQVAVGKIEAAAVDNSENAQEMRMEKALAESMEFARLRESRVEQTAEAPVQVEKNVAETENFEDRGVSFPPEEVSQVETSEQNVEITPAVSMMEVLPAEDTVEITAEEMMETESHREPTKITSTVEVTEVACGEMTDVTPAEIKEAVLGEEPIEISPAVGVTEAICSDVTTELTATEVAEAVLGEEPIEISQAIEVTGVMCRGIDEITPEGAITVMHDEESTEITLAGIREIITGVQPVEISPLPLTEIAPGKEPIDINATMGVTEVVCSEVITEITPGLVSKTLPSEEPIKVTPVGVTEAVLGEAMTELDPMGVTDIPLGKEPSEIIPVRITEALCSEEKTEHSVALVQEIAPVAIEQVLKPDAAQSGERQHLPPKEHQVVDENVFTTTISKGGALSVEDEKTVSMEVDREQALTVGKRENVEETEADGEQSVKIAEKGDETEPQTIAVSSDKAGAEQITECRKTEIILAPEARKDEAAMEQVDDTKSDVAQQVAVGKIEAAAVDNSENAQEMRVEKALAESMEVASLQESRVEQTAEAPVQVEKNVAETENFEETAMSFLPEKVSQVETSEQNVEVTPAVSMMEVLPAEDTVEITAEEMMEIENHIEPTKITSEVGATEVACGEMTALTPEGIKEAVLGEEPIKISPTVRVNEAVCSDVTTEITTAEVAEAVLGEEPIEISQAVEATGVMRRGIDEITPEGATSVVCNEEMEEISSVGVREIIPGEQPVGISPLYLTEIVPAENTIGITPVIGKTEMGETWEEPTEITPELVSATLPSEEPVKIIPTVGMMEAVCGEEFTELAPLEEAMVKTGEEQHGVVSVGVTGGGGEEAMEPVTVVHGEVVATASLEVGVEESKYAQKEGEIPQQEESERSEDDVQKVMDSEVEKQFSTAVIVQQDMGTENLDNMVRDQPVEALEQQRTQKAAVDSLSSATQILQSITTEGGSNEKDKATAIKGEVKSEALSDELKGTVSVQPAALVTAPSETSPREHPEKSVMEAAGTQAGELLAAKQVETEGACVTSELPSTATEGEGVHVEQTLSQIESAGEVECQLASKEKDKPLLDESMKKITLVQGGQLTAASQGDQSVPSSKLCQHIEGAAEPQGSVELKSPSAVPLVEEQALTLSVPQGLVELSKTKHEDTKACTTLESASDVKLCPAFVNECQTRQNETVPPVEGLSVVGISESSEEAVLVAASSAEEVNSAEVVAAEIPEHSAVDQVLPPYADVKQVSIVATASEVDTGHIADNSGTGLITNVQKAESCRRVQIEDQPVECKIKESIIQKKKCLETQIEVEVSQTQVLEQQSTQAAQGLVQDAVALSQLQGQDSMKKEENLIRLQKDMAVNQELETSLSQDIERKEEVLMQSAEMTLTTTVSSGQGSTETETLASMHSESTESASGKFSLSSETTKAECHLSLDQSETTYPSMELTEQTQLVTIQTLVRGELVNESLERNENSNQL